MPPSLVSDSLALDQYQSQRLAPLDVLGGESFRPCIPCGRVVQNKP